MDNVYPEPLRVHADRLAGKRILVDGGASGIGAAAIRRFGEEGADVGDIRREADVERIVTTVVDRLGGLDGAPRLLRCRVRVDVPDAGQLRDRLDAILATPRRKLSR